MPQARDKYGRFVSNSNGHKTASQTSNVQQRYPIAREVANMLDNMATSLRTGLATRLRDERRSINDECGYPETENLTAQDYRNMYDREAVANRVVDVLPLETWAVTPNLVEDDDPEVETKFEKAWRELGKQLEGNSKYDSETGNCVWQYLLRVDRLSGIGSFGVLLLGLDDGADLMEPVQSTSASLLYLRAFDESTVTVDKWNTDVSDPRYNKPEVYGISMGYREGEAMTGLGRSSNTLKVHWSRVIHVADNLFNDEVLGIPRMRPVYNRLWDLRKLYGGSAEMYWQGAFPGISFETHPQLGGDVQVNESALKDMVEEYMNGLQRYLSLRGMSANSLAPQVVDPTPQINAELDAICIQIGVPKRVFVGSERGELASSQDDVAWDDRLGQRQNLHVTPRIIVPFVDRLITFGILPEPQQYRVEWPDRHGLSEEDQAMVVAKRMEAMSKYIAGGVDILIPPHIALVKEFGYTPEEAETITEEALERIEEQRAEEEQAMQDQEGEPAGNNDTVPGGSYG